MKFGGDFVSNFSSANGSNNLDYKKDVILDEVARLIEFEKATVISVLKDSGYKLSPNSSKKQVIDATIKALYNSPQFQKDIATEIVKSNGSSFSNANGEWRDKLFGGRTNSQTGTSGGAGASGAGSGAGKIGADPISAIAGAIGSIFSFASASKNKKAEEERTRQAMYDKLLGGGSEKNWVPVVVVSGVLLVGGIVTFFALRNKK